MSALPPPQPVVPRRPRLDVRVGRAWKRMPRWQKAALIALVVVAVITIGAFASKTKTSTDTPPSNQPSMTACQALDKLHAEMSSQSSFVAAGKDLLNGLSPSSYDIARVQILGDCPQYAEVLR